MHGFRLMYYLSWSQCLPLTIQTVIFKPQSAALKEAIDDLEWPGSSVQIILQPDPPSVTFKGEGHGDLQVRFYFKLKIKYPLCLDFNIFRGLILAFSCR